MSLPVMGEHFSWIVRKSQSCTETLIVSLWLKPEDPRFAPIGQRPVDVYGVKDGAEIVERVEHAAWEIYNSMQRDIFIDTVIGEHWPCPQS